MRIINKLSIGLLLFFALCTAYAQQPVIEKEEREYKVERISETPRYFVVETKTADKKAILVIYKKSDQLSDIKLKIGKSYKFKTYDYFDVMSFGEYFHEVDSVEIWNTDKYPETNLHFTDGMGNGYLESNQEKKDRN